MQRSQSPALRRDAGRGLASVLIVILIVGGIAYLANERFRSEVDQSYEKLSSWSEEAIAEDPVNYLDFVERSTKSTLADLKTSELKLAAEQAKLEARSTGAVVKIRAGEQALFDLRRRFRDAEKGGGFPVEWRGESRDREFMVEQLLSLDTELRHEKAMADTVGQTLSALNGARDRIRELRARCERQLTTITADREIARVGQLDEKTRRRFADMKAVISDGRDFVEKPGQLVSLDDIASGKVEGVDDREAALKRILEER
jgi:hypothetical protein